VGSCVPRDDRAVDRVGSEDDGQLDEIDDDAAEETDGEEEDAEDADK